MPFKAQLRDLVLWLKGEPACCPGRPTDWQASLSAFLAHLVWHQSGGHSFSVSDLQQVLTNSAVLLLLDGLDEIAEPEQRDRVVNEISRTVTRLRHNAKSLQVVVTSRPVAFINSAGLSESLFQYAELQPVTLPLVRVFAERWSKAQKLRPKDLEALLSTLEAKLAEPHVRDLARNPMQLAILLTLLHTRGVALPDQRTALYDNYIDIFLDREAVKSEVVREHRGLLRDIHAYLGWELHSQAELGRSNGAISGEDLDAQLRAYLSSKHQDPELSTELFGTAVLRVVAIVSRIQGTFEFEVQTLREYFAGRYLYETAPYAPVGQEKPGTKPERFEAIARNFYWLNVARFYAGCHTSGELPSLAEQICELAEIEANNPFAYTSHPTVLSGMLLSDWVFAQSPSSVMKLVDLTSGGVGIRHAWLRAGRPASLPSKCGGTHLVKRCWELLDTHVNSGFARDLCSVLLANVSTDEFDRAWLAKVEAATTDRRHPWLRVGRQTGSLQRSGWGALRELVLDHDGAAIGLEELIAAGRDEALQEHPDWAGPALRGVLDGELLLGQEAISVRNEGPVSVVTLLRLIHEPKVWLSLAARSYTLHLLNKGVSSLLELDVKDDDQDLLLQCHDVIQSFERGARDQAEFFDEYDLTPLSKFLEDSRRTLGVRWIHHHLAAVSAGFGEARRGGRGAELSDEEAPLLERARRATASDLARWQRQLNGLARPRDAWFALAVLFSWSRPRLIVALTDEIERLLGDLQPAAFARLVHTVKVATLQSDTTMLLGSSTRTARPGAELQQSDLPAIISCRFATMLALRTSPASVAMLYDRCGGVSVEQAKNGLEHLALAGVVGRIQGNHVPSWRQFLAVVASLYARDLHDPVALLPDLTLNNIEMPLELARIVMSKAEEYPREIVSIADRRCREKAGEMILPLATVAKRDKWFAER